MKIEKAEQLLKLYLNQPNISDDPDIQDAIRLAIEALKWIEDLRRVAPVPNPDRLPGETKE